ncbi:MAG: Conserved hypothetical periplasmic protein [Verrucomicrobia bacterium]|nr:Conserved hypothetical periplasmic protein [Verrucomicrobiota bacterium]
MTPPPSPIFRPSRVLFPDRATNLIAADGARTDGLISDQPYGHAKFPVGGWRAREQQIEWEIEVPTGDTYAITVVFQHISPRPLEVHVVVADQDLHATSESITYDFQWKRLVVSSGKLLPKGVHRVVLRLEAAQPDEAFEAKVHAIELIRPQVAMALDQAAREMRSRADPAWFREARFGLFFHWTSEVYPRHGARKPYADAVRDFDVDAFAAQAAQTGAGFIVLTTAHAEMYFPAPLASLEAILPGRTTSRDLVAELIAALGRHGLRLFLYYHLGSVSDPSWLEASGFWATDTAPFFERWERVIGEIGQRYGAGLGGWWFDDGLVNYYYRSPDWERLARAAKSGNPARLITFNPWQFMQPSPFADYYAGEMNVDPSVGGCLAPEDNGIIHAGVYRELQASTADVAEGDWHHWVHNTPDQEIVAPRWTPAELAELLRRNRAFHNVPIFNLELYQDGRCSPKTLEMFIGAKALG